MRDVGVTADLSRLSGKGISRSKKPLLTMVTESKPSTLNDCDLITLFFLSSVVEQVCMGRVLESHQRHRRCLLQNPRLDQNWGHTWKRRKQNSTCQFQPGRMQSAIA